MQEGKSSGEEGNSCTSVGKKICTDQSPIPEKGLVVLINRRSRRRLQQMGVRVVLMIHRPYPHPHALCGVVL